jgi:hypothetical protein
LADLRLKDENIRGLVHYFIRKPSSVAEIWVHIVTFDQEKLTLSFSPNLNLKSVKVALIYNFCFF